MAATRKLVVQVVGDAKGLKKAFEQAAWESMSFGQKVAATSKKMAIPAAAAFGALTAAGLSFAKAAADDQRAQALLATQLQNTTGATRAQVAATEDFISKLSIAKGVADDELRPALAQLVRATGNVSSAQSLLRTALDVSAGSGKDLGSVVMALSRASQGQFTALKRLGIPLSDNIIKSKDFNAVLQVLNGTFRGQSDVAAATAEGQMRRFGVAVQEAKESIGAMLLPAIEAILPKLVGMANWAQRNAGVIAAVGTVIGALAGALLIGVTALKVWQTSATIAAAVNAGLASSFFAVQIATGIGIATALAGAAAVAVIAVKMKNAAKATDTFTASLDNNREATRKALAYDVAKGLLPSSSLKRFDDNTKSMNTSIGGIGTKVAKTVDQSKQKFKQFVDAVKSAKDAVRQWVDGVKESIASNVSLSDSFSIAQKEQSDAADALTQALKDRKEAYAKLNQAKQNDDAEAYAEALQNVADAEAAVSKAQEAKPRNYSQVFADQVAAAKNFASNLAQLASTGMLSQAALQQLVALGPIAGAQVTADMLAGTAGFTAASLSADLAGVDAAAMAVGMSMPGVSALLGSSVGKSGDNYYITVNAGVGDKNAIANEVVDLLKVYNRSNGAIPVRVSAATGVTYGV